MYTNGSVPTGSGMLHGGGCHQYHLGDNMNGKVTILLSGLVAILMVTCAVPFIASEDSDALIGNSADMSLNVDSAVIYVSGSPTYVDLYIDVVPEDADEDYAEWELNDIGDGTSCVSLSANAGGAVRVNAGSLGTADVKSVEVVANLGSSHASAVIVVYSSPGTTATAFHFYLKVDASAIPSGVTPQTTYNSNCPISYRQITSGVWIEVKQSDYTGSDSWSAMSAFQWYCDTYGISCNASGGWISDILNLGTYSGNNGVWYYWAQYHVDNGAWAFNNTTMAYMTTVDSSYIGLIFWGSPNAYTMPDFPGYPA